MTESMPRRVVVSRAGFKRCEDPLPAGRGFSVFLSRSFRSLIRWIGMGVLGCQVLSKHSQLSHEARDTMVNFLDLDVKQDAYMYRDGTYRVDIEGKKGCCSGLCRLVNRATKCSQKRIPPKYLLYLVAGATAIGCVLCERYYIDGGRFSRHIGALLMIPFSFAAVFLAAAPWRRAFEERTNGSKGFWAIISLALTLHLMANMLFLVELSNDYSIEPTLMSTQVADQDRDDEEDRSEDLWELRPSFRYVALTLFGLYMVLLFVAIPIFCWKDELISLHRSAWARIWVWI